MEKKGISPLIATVLILGFTVALAAVIMTWGSVPETGVRGSESRISLPTDLSIGDHSIKFRASDPEDNVL